jgi:DNA-binding CsgD family transcriptional regulator/tetratricopeptide (TPR) repeat protein
MGLGQRVAESGELLERDEAMSALDDMLASVQTEASGKLVWVGGEAGVGKTALLGRFCELQDKPVRTLWGACEPLRTPRPLGPFVDVGEATGGELAELLAGATRPHEVAGALLDELSGRRPTVLVLEDLHWADEATLDVVTLLAARISSVPALVLASYRDDELDRAPTLRVVLGELARRPGRLKVERLSAAAVAALADQHGLDAAELYARTAGNPFFVTEVLAAGGERLPETVRDAVLARAARLSQAARRLLEAVAVVPGQVELWLLKELAGELVDRLEECLGSGMLSAGPTSVAFRHELARLAVEEAIPPNRRLALHRAALAALVSASHHDSPRIAHHAESSADVAAVLQWAPRAAEQAAASGAHREAAAQYARALRFADGQPDEVRADLLQARAEECYLTSRIDDAIDAQREALECRRRRRDGRAEGNALRILSRLLFFAGRASEAEPLVLEAIELLEQLPAGHELAMAYANISQRRMVVDDAAEAMAWGNRALALARSLADTEAQAYALTNIAAAQFRTNADEGHQQLEAALELAQRNGHEELAGLTFSRLVMFPVRYRRFDMAQDHLDAGLEYCVERGLDTFRLYLLGCRARLELDLGHWDQAAESAALVLRDPRGAQLARTWALATLGLLRARRGDAEASVPLEEAHAMVEPTFELDRIAQVDAARAEAAWLASDRAAVAGITDAALALALERRDSWAVGELVYWRWRAGLRDKLPAGLAAEPYALSFAGDWKRAAELWRKIGCPYEAALALADSDDETDVRQAHDQLQALGARPAAAIVARRLRERGVRSVPRGPRPRTRENPAGLTARELEVLVLVADGLRNGQIAQRLVVSEKTIDHHVSAILRKLDVRTRGEAAAEAARRGLTGTAKAGGRGPGERSAPG